MLTGENGILTQAQRAKNETEEARIEEENTLTTYEDYINNATNDTAIVGEIVQNGNKQYSNHGTAIIPEGFMIVPGCDNVSQGLVISDNPDDTEEDSSNIVAKGNQFVWIPVPYVIFDGNTEINENYTPMAKSSDNATNYQGILYTFKNTESIYQEDYKPGTTNYREPSLITDSNNDTYAILDNVTGTNYDGNYSFYNTILGYSDSKEFGKDMQNDFNEMIESVNKNKGFYVGRYELGIENSEPVVKNASKNSGVITAEASNTDGSGWYGLYKKCKEFTETANKKLVVSSMIYGCQYDAMMNWMAKSGENIGVGVPNSEKFNQTQVTGNNPNDTIKKIFDLYGCHLDWTLEAYDKDRRVCRGSSDGSFSPSYRTYGKPDGNGDNIGSRITLYIK